MSLTAHLLLNRPIALPVGSPRAHYIEPPVVVPSSQVLNSSVKARNIEAVYAAVADGQRTVPAVMAATRLSHTTVQKALNALYTWPGGRRIDYSRPRREKLGGIAYHWTAIK